MPSNEQGYRLAKTLEKKYQMYVNSLAEAGAGYDDPRYKQAAEQLTGVGRTIDDYEAENRVTDEQGKLLKAPVTRLPVVSDPSKDKSGFNYHYEPSVREAQEALRANPKLLQELDPTGEWSGIAEAEQTPDVADPMSGAVGGQGYTPPKTWLDNLTDHDSLYKKYGDRLWEQRIEQARQRGEGVQRYRDIELKGQPADFLIGGAEKGVQKIVAPAASAAGDVLSMGTLDTVGKSNNQTLNEANRKYGLPEVPYESTQEIQNRNPPVAMAANLAAYAMPGNIINSATELAVKGLGYGTRGALGKAGISALTGAVGNTVEGGIMDTVHGMNAGQSFGDAASAAAENIPLNLAFGGGGGALFDTIGQAAGNVRTSFRRGIPELKVLEDAGGHTSLPRGVVPPPEVKEFVERSERPRAIGSPAAFAAEEVAPHIEQSLETQAADAQKKIEGEKEQYFNHPAYRDMEESAGPAIRGLAHLANQGWASGPVTGAPRNVNMGQIERIGKIIREYTDVPQIVRREDAQAFADHWDGTVLDGELGNRLYGLDERTAAPPGYSIVAVPIKVNARKLTNLEQLIDEELKSGSLKGRDNDPVWTQIDRDIKGVRDKFPYYVDDADQLIPPPDWVDPNAPKSPEGGDGPVLDGEFVDSSPPDPGTGIEPRGPSSSMPPSGGGAGGPGGGGPELGGGGAPQLHRGMVSPEEATPLSLLAGNRLAMEAPRERTERMLPPGRPDESRGPLERMLDGGLEGAPALPVSEIEDAAFRQQADRDKTAKAWEENEAPAKEWYEDIVAPGRTPRSDEVKRMMDLTEQQRAMEEAMGEMNNVDRRLGPIPDKQKDDMLIQLISKRLGRKVTREELVKAGLLAGGVAAASTAEDSETGAAMAGIGGLLGVLPKGSLSLKTKSQLGALARVKVKDFLENPDIIDDVLGEMRSNSSIPNEDKTFITDSLFEFRRMALESTEDLPKVADATPKEPSIEDDLASEAYDGPMSEGKLFQDTNLPVDTSQEVVDIVNKVNKITEEKLKTLTPKEKNYIQQWGRSSSGFKKAFKNTSMSDDEARKHWRELGYSDADIDRRNLIDVVKNKSDDKEIVAVLGSAFEKLKIDNPTQYGTLHRGLAANDKSYNQPELQELLTKDTFVSRTPISTSYNREASKDFYGRAFTESKTSPVMLDFVSVRSAAPKFHPGTHSLSADARVRESEVIIPPGATFRVVSRTKEPGYKWRKESGLNKRPEDTMEVTVIKLEQVEDAPREAWKNAAMIGAALGIGAAADDEEGAGAGAAGAMAVGMGRRRGKGKGGGRSKPPGGPSSIMDDIKPQREPRQLEAELDDKTKVKGFSALRRKQHLAQSQLETSKKRVGAGGEKTIRDRVIGFNQGDDKIYDDALLEEATKAGKKEELFRAGAASVYPSLNKKAWFRGGEGIVNRTANAAGLHLDPVMEMLSGAQRNPFIRTPPGVMEDMLRQFLNVTGGRTGARHGDDFRRIYEALYGEQEQEEERP